MNLHEDNVQVLSTSSLKYVYLGISLLVLISISVFIAFFSDRISIPVLSSFLVRIFSFDFFLFLIVGFIAQIIDGSLGMAYGVSSTTFLMSIGIPPASASASVHVAEIFTTGASGISHIKFGNVNKELFKGLILPGVLGAVLGALSLFSIDGNLIKPFIAAYLLIMGIIIIRKAMNRGKTIIKDRKIAPLALFGGFVDAIGGGGWGPVVTSTLIGRGHNPRYTIGAVNLAEFFIALAGAGTFTIMMGLDSWVVIVGLILGGVLASPFAAYICKKAQPKPLMLIVGAIIILLSIRTIVTAIF